MHTLYVHVIVFTLKFSVSDSVEIPAFFKRPPPSMNLILASCRAKMHAHVPEHDSVKAYMYAYVQRGTCS